MKKEKFYVLSEKVGRQTNGYIPEIKVLIEKPEAIKDGWNMDILEVERLKTINRFVIADSIRQDNVYGTISSNLSQKDAQKVVEVVRSIDNHNIEMIFHILNKISGINDSNEQVLCY